MTPFKSLSRQIVMAYLLFTAACCLLFIIVGVIVVEGIEVKLVDERLKEVAAWAAPRYAGGLPVEMPTGLSFHHGDGIPLSLRSLQEGVQEVSVDGIGLHVLGGSTAAGPFVVVDHESDYEKVEQAVYSMLSVSVLGFLGLALFLGRFMARRFVSPIIDLSAAVADRRVELPLLNTNNELGALARAFDHYAKEMQHYLDRERFFTGDVSHELRTPLTVIRGAVEIIELEATPDSALRAPVDRINRALKDASDSVNVLLMLARSPHLIEAAEVSAAAVAQELVVQYQFLVRDKAVKLLFEGGEFRINVPSKLLEAALGNLIRNACLYTESGAVTVRIVGQAIQVHDSGGGMPTAVLAMLTHDRTQRFTGSGGTGLGLALVKRICEYIGATLRVVTTSEAGSIVEIDCASVLHKKLTAP